MMVSCTLTAKVEEQGRGEKRKDGVMNDARVRARGAGRKNGRGKERRDDNGREDGESKKNVKLVEEGNRWEVNNMKR